MMTKTQYDFVKLLENCKRPPACIDGRMHVWLSFDQLEVFTKALGSSLFEEGSFEVILFETSVCIDINDVLEYMDIDEDIFKVEG